MNTPTQMPAFPVPAQVAAIQSLAGQFPLTGMTRRDYFAAAALTGVIAAGTAASNGLDMAEMAVAIADLTLEQLNRAGK